MPRSTQHFKKTFDHKLGRLTDTSQSEADNAADLAEAQNAPNGANALSQMLVSPTKACNKPSCSTKF